MRSSLKVLDRLEETRHRKLKLPLEGYRLDLDWNSILVSLIFSGVGFVYFSYGKKQSHFVMMLCGLSLMFYSYFVDSILWAIGIGVALSVAPFFRWPSQK